MNLDESESDEDFEDVKEIRKQRITNKRKLDAKTTTEERSIQIHQRRPRVKVHWDPEWDEDDYDFFYE